MNGLAFYTIEGPYPTAQRARGKCITCGGGRARRFLLSREPAW
jgi:hypothetical protein